LNVNSNEHYRTVLGKLLRDPERVTLDKLVTRPIATVDDAPYPSTTFAVTRQGPAAARGGASQRETLTQTRGCLRQPALTVSQQQLRTSPLTTR
jgi:hypothetical protein